MASFQGKHPSVRPRDSHCRGAFSTSHDLYQQPFRSLVLEGFGAWKACFAKVNPLLLYSSYM